MLSIIESSSIIRFYTEYRDFNKVYLKALTRIKVTFNDLLRNRLHCSHDCISFLHYHIFHQLFPGKVKIFWVK